MATLEIIALVFGILAIITCICYWATFLYGANDVITAIFLIFFIISLTTTNILGIILKVMANS